MSRNVPVAQKQEEGGVLETIKVIIQAVEKAGYKLGKQIYLGMDVAASEFYKKNIYDLAGEGRKYKSDEFVKYFAKLAAK